jgi:dihydropteroate synthase
MRLQARQFEFAFPRPTLVMGILNVTPDSFSDGGEFLDPTVAIARAHALVAQGADLLDIGGESTRPGAAPVPEAEELRRVMPVLEGLIGQISVPISIDTMKIGVARAALAVGAAIINDVGASRADPAMWRLVAESSSGYVCMHMQGTPQTMQANPRYQDVVREVGEFFHERLNQMGGCGIAREQIILDPGIGFGKTVDHNLTLISNLRAFESLERPLLLGVSRKSFLGLAVGPGVGARLPAALACACLGVEAGAHLVRTHDVAETCAALRLTEAVLAKRMA